MSRTNQHIAPNSIRGQFRKLLKKDRTSRWAYRLLIIMVVVALLGDFIANERPLVCKIDNQVHFPVFKQYGVDLGLTKWEGKFLKKKWHDQTYDWVVYPPIPYTAKTQDFKNSGYSSPFDRQDVSSMHFWHWMGTDGLGRDVLAGMISGTRTALLVGIVAMGVAGLIGVILGLLAGYFGNTVYKISYIRLILMSLGFLLGIFYGFTSRDVAFEERGFLFAFTSGLLILIFFLSAFSLLAKSAERFPFFQHKTHLPIDAIVLRMIEVLNAIPGLLLLLSIVALFPRPSLTNIMIIIGLLSWTGIARFVRAELMKIRQMEYIQAAKALGYSNNRIMWRHALPNALGPVMITLAFGIAGAILVEAFLSFLGIGLPVDMVTWGTMLNKTREATYAWWMAVFPGGAIFLTVTIFNLLGENLSKIK